MTPHCLVHSCTSAEEYSAIRTPACGAVVLNHTPSQLALDWLASLSEMQLPSERITLPPATIRTHVHTLMPVVDAADIANRDWLIQDIATLANDFAALMDAPYVRMRLDVIKTNACRRFHVDAVTARLVCTYRGQTTQFGYSESNEDPKDIHAVPPACPVIVRGTKWPDDAPARLRHRSPPIEGTGQTRLLLVLDPMDTDEDNLF